MQSTARARSYPRHSVQSNYDLPSVCAVVYMNVDVYRLELQRSHRELVRTCPPIASQRPLTTVRAVTALQSIGRQMYINIIYSYIRAHPEEERRVHVAWI